MTMYQGDKVAHCDKLSQAKNTGDFRLNRGKFVFGRLSLNRLPIDTLNSGRVALRHKQKEPGATQALAGPS
jgi:hypothetical protein